MIKFFLSLLLLSISILPAKQDEQLQIRLRRNWGYASGTGKIQGTFTIRASGPGDLSRVVFYLDDQVLGEVNGAPFELRFVTDDYPLGLHQIQAAGTTAGGLDLQSNVIQTEFVTAGEGWQAASNFIVPLVVIILAAVGLAILVPIVFTRGKKEQLPPGAPRNYGVHGGAICPKCSRPFSRHIYGLNLGLHKYDRCPYCGKWSLVRRESKEVLEAAEAAEITAAGQGKFTPDRSEEYILRQEIEDSRFDDL
jgi:DNA-directed RNA polymerase subunit RPC12/RpoP